MRYISTICLSLVITALFERSVLSEPDSRRLKSKEADRTNREADEKKKMMQHREEIHKKRIELWNEDKHSYESPDISKVCSCIFQTSSYTFKKLTLLISTLSMI